MRRLVSCPREFLALKRGDTSVDTARVGACATTDNLEVLDLRLLLAFPSCFE